MTVDSKIKGQHSADCASRILEYITRKDAVAMGNGKPLLFYTHNIRGSTIEKLAIAFKQNEANRIYTSSNRIYGYHEMIAFLEVDRVHLTNRVLLDIAEYYLDKRAPNGMSAYTFHTMEDKHPHIHFLVGATEIATGKALRLTNEEFAKIKIQLQDYQKENYPELTSIVEHRKGSYAKSNDDERQMKERTNKPSRKDEIIAILNQAFKESISPDDFYSKASEPGKSE